MRKKKKSSSPISKQAPNINEKALVLLMTQSFLRHLDEEAAGQSPTLPGFEAAVPHFWLAMARGAAAIATKEHRNKPESPESGRKMFEEARRWMHRALQVAFTADVLHGAAQILMAFGDLELIRDEGELSKEGDVQKLFEEAADYLDNAAKLAPARPDILSDLAHVLFIRSSCKKGSAEVKTLREALRRSQEALACFSETNRQVAATGELHPLYSRYLWQAGTLGWFLGTKITAPDEKREILQEAHEQLHQAESKGSEESEGLMILGQVALELSWLLSSPQARRDLLTEACDRFTAAIAVDPEDYQALSGWGGVLVGFAAFARGEEMTELLVKSEDKLARAARLFPDWSEAHLDAARAWLRLAGESSAEGAREGSLRAVEAARRANGIEPGSGDYLLACALSRLGQLSEAAEVLASALARDPDQGAQALSDPHLEPVWVSRPELRHELTTGRQSTAEDSIG